MYVKSAGMSPPIAGAAFAAHKDTWPRWAKAFYAALNDYVAQKRFAGDDQAVATTVCLRHRDLCAFAAIGWNVAEGGRATGLQPLLHQTAKPLTLLSSD